MAPLKATKQAARYTGAGGREHCSKCRFFVIPSSCRRIIGPVSPAGWCKYFSQELVWAFRDQGGGDADIAAATGPAPPTLDLNFTTMSTLDPSVTFARASTATYFNSAGIMQTAASGAPRFGYDPNALTPNGLLIEESRSNIQINSNFATGWNPGSNAALTVNAATGPDGTTSAASFLATNTTASIRETGAGTPATAAAGTYTVSVFMRSSATPTNGYIQVNTASNASIAYYDLTAGTPVVGADLAAGITNKSAQITKIGNFWRLQFTFTTPAGATTLTPYFGACQTVSATGDNRSYTGVVGQGIYLFGAQIEAGAFATSYIATTTTSVTRAADVATLASIPGRNPAAESFAANALLITSQEANPRLVGGSASTRAPLFAAATLHGAITDGTALQTTNTGTLGTVLKMASTWTSGAANVCLNAGAVATSATLTTGFSGDTTLKLMGDNTTTDQANGYIQRFRYWPRVLSSAELQSVTT